MLVIFFKLLLVIFLPLHPYYVSVIDIHHNKKDKNLEISIKAFTDDFEKTINQKYHTQLDLLQPTHNKNLNDLVIDYVKRHLKLTVNGKVENLVYLGYEIEKESIHTYWEVRNIQDFKSLDVWQNFLYERAAEQFNIFNISTESDTQSFRLTNPETTYSLHF